MGDGFQIFCARCKKQLAQPGALIISPPSEFKRLGTYYHKHHLCQVCFDQLIAWLVTFIDVKGKRAKAKRSARRTLKSKEDASRRPQALNSRTGRHATRAAR